MKNLKTSLMLMSFLIMQLKGQVGSSFFGTANISNPNTNEVVNAVARDGSNNVYVTGKFNNKWMVRKYNSSFTIISAFSFPLSLDGEGTDIKILTDINTPSNTSLYVIGHNSLGYDPCVYRLNLTSGAVISSKCYQGGARFNAITATPGGITIGGTLTNELIDNVINDNLDHSFNGSILDNPTTYFNNSSAICLIKLNINLTHVWWTGIADNTNSACNDISTVNIGTANNPIYNTYVTGYFGAKGLSAPTFKFPGVSTITGSGGTDIFLAKFPNNSSEPTFSWVKKAGGTFTASGLNSSYNLQDYGTSVEAVFSSGVENSYLTGRCMESAQFGTNPALNCQNNGNAFGFLAKYDNNGTAVWSSIMGQCVNAQSLNNCGYGIAIELGTTNIYVTGSSNYSNDFNSGIYIGKYNTTTGAAIWHNVAKNMTSAGFDERKGKAISMFGSCDLLVAGSYNGTVRFGTNTSQQLIGNATDAFMSKLPRTGVWQGLQSANCTAGPFTISASGGASYLWSGAQTTSSISVTPTSVTNYSVTITNGFCSNQYTQTVNPSWPANAGPDIDFPLGDDCPPCQNIGIALPGNPSYAWSLPGNSNICNTNVTAAQPSVTLAGLYTVNAGYAGCPGTTDQMIVTHLSVCPDKNRIKTNSYYSDSELGIYPNPNNGEFTISMKDEDLKDLIIRDIFGKIVLEQKDINSSHINISLKSIGSGIYMMSTSNHTSTETKIHKIVVRD
jgi:Secretion system C-terminal sorting domain